MAVFRLLAGVAALGLLAIGSTPALADPPDPGTPVPGVLNVPLFPGIDQYGNQFEVVQAYQAEGSSEQSITAGIYDTGASVVAFSWIDQDVFFPLQFQPTIPIKSFGGATADAIGGTLTGNVSQPGKILAAGASALNIDFNTFSYSYDLSSAVSVGGVQAFVGTSSTSPNLPAIVGTPINVKSVAHPNGLATVLDQSGYSLNLSGLDPAFGNVPFDFPDVRFVDSGYQLKAADNTTYQTVSFPVTLFGDNNMANPGNLISAAENPVQDHTSVTFTPAAAGSLPTTLSDQKFLFDTGAQISIISPHMAALLGLTDEAGNPIAAPFDFIDVQGAGDKVVGLPGYILDSLTLPRTDGGLINFTDVPVYVLDVGFGIDGILGMNLFNAADSFVYDPYHPGGPQVSVLFLNDRSESALAAEAAKFENADLDFLEQSLLELTGSKYTTVNAFLPGFAPKPVPEPSTMCLGLIGFAALAFRLRRKIR